MLKLGVMYGGKSPEHDVSLRTAKEVLTAIDYAKFSVHPIFITKQGEFRFGSQRSSAPDSVDELQFLGGASGIDVLRDANFDIVFPLLHGPNGEDGTIQGLLELLNIPYVGNGVLASAAGMDKVIMKDIFASAGLAQADYIWYLRSEWEVDATEIYTGVETRLGYPCFVKPANMGSSVGISKAMNRAELEAAFALAFKYDRKVVVEVGVNGREIEIGVMGNDDPITSAVGEILPRAEFYDYEAKYESDATGLKIPAPMSVDVASRMAEEAIRAYKALDLSGLVRADFFLVDEKDLLINEVNTMPGFTSKSMYPMLFQEVGITYPAIIERLIELGITRHQEKQKITF